MIKVFRTRALGLGFAAACCMVVGIGVGAYYSTHQLVRSFGSVSKSHQAIEKLQAINELLQAGQSSAYNYVITGREERLDVYYQANRQFPRRLKELEGLVQNHPKQKSALKQFRRLLELHQKYLFKIVLARQQEGAEAAARWVAEEDDHAVRDVLGTLLREIQKEQNSVLRGRSVLTSKNSLRTRLVLAGAAGGILLVIAWLFGWLRRESGAREHVESKNLRLEIFLRSIVERIPYMVLVKEADSLRITLANKAAAEWLGRSEADLLGSNDYDLRPKADAKAAVQQDREILRQGGAVDIPAEVLLRDGQEQRILHTQKVVIPDENGQPAFLLVISEDITRRIESERLMELSRDTAVQSERLKSEFIRNMSHEIRTPLSIVVGMTSILMDSQLTPEQRAFAAKVEHAASGLAKLTKEILDFSRIEAGTFTVEMQEMNLRQTIEGIQSMLAAQAKAKGVGLVSLFPPTIPQVVVGDPIRLRQVLTELIGNALKFTERGEVIVRVTEAEQTDTQYWLTIKISDTGVGMDAQVQKHLFEPFRQGDGSPTRRFGGTGLGLAISKRIVELMGGKIGFESTPQSGSTFWCTLPFQKRGAQSRSVQVATLPWTKARVLVVEENGMLRQQLREQLNAWGLASEAVPSGGLALELLRREAQAGRGYQIVVLDMYLADMDGVMFTRKVKAEPALSKIFVVVLTETPMDPATVSQLGFSAAITKPVNPDSLLDQLAGLIEAPQHLPKSAA